MRTFFGSTNIGSPFCETVWKVCMQLHWQKLHTVGGSAKCSQTKGQIKSLGLLSITQHFAEVSINSCPLWISSKGFPPIGRKALCAFKEMDIFSPPGPNETKWLLRKIPYPPDFIGPLLFPYSHGPSDWLRQIKLKCDKENKVINNYLTSNANSMVNTKFAKKLTVSRKYICLQKGIKIQLPVRYTQPPNYWRVQTA